MSAQTDIPVEGTETETPTQETQNSELTSAESKDSSAVEDVVTALVGNDAFMEQIRRVAQSEKDKGNAAAQEQVVTLSEEVNRLSKYLDKTPEEIQRASEKADLDDMVKAFKDGRPVQPAPSSVLGSADVEQLASSLTDGLTPEAQQKLVADAKAQAFTDANSLAQFIIKSVATEAQKPLPTEANITQQSSTQTPVSADDAAIGTEFDRLLSNPDLTMNERMVALKEYDEKLAKTTYEQ